MTDAASQNALVAIRKQDSAKEKLKLPTNTWEIPGGGDPAILLVPERPRLTRVMTGHRAPALVVVKGYPDPKQYRTCESHLLCSTVSRIFKDGHAM
ncbi:hypothetical protein PM082_014814 [Marasmius tenuissimus]|nr:hypothetical protein PM082_014814 [Marasmius tenuissimus]